MDKILNAIDFIVKNVGRADATGKTPLGKLLDTDINTLHNEAEELKTKLESFRKSGNGK